MYKSYHILLPQKWKNTSLDKKCKMMLDKKCKMMLES